MTDQNVNTAGTDLTYAEAMAFAKIVYGIDTAAGYVQQDQWTKRYESAAGLVDIEMWGARQYRVKLVEPLTIKPTPVVVTMDELAADTDTAPVTGQPAPTFDELRAATNAASAAELAAHNALVKAENAYASAAEVDPNDRHGWNRATGRFARTKAGQELHAALTEARKTLREAVRVDTEACRKTWVNGFRTLQPVTEQPAPVCGTCGGEGDCMDCDTLTIEDAQEHVTELKAIYNRCRLSNWQENNPNRAALLRDQDDNIKALEAYIARRQVAPVDSSDLALDAVSLDYTHGFGDAVFGYPRHNGRSSDYQAGYDAGLQDKNDAPDLTVTPDERPGIITQLASLAISSADIVLEHRDYLYTAPVTEQPAPTCPTCGSNWMTCEHHDALTIESAAEWVNILTGIISEARAIVNDDYPTETGYRIYRAGAEIEALQTYIARWNNLLSITGFVDAAPVDPSSLALDSATPDYSDGYADATTGKPRHNGRNAPYQLGYDDGLEVLDDDLQDDIMPQFIQTAHNLDAARDEIKRLNRIIEGLQADFHTCERKVKATQDAADNAATAALAEIEQLTARLDAVIGGEPVIKIWHDAEYDPRPWRYAIRECSRVAQFDCKTEAEAQEKTQTHLENWRKEQARARR